MTSSLPELSITKNVNNRLSVFDSENTKPPVKANFPVSKKKLDLGQ